MFTGLIEEIGLVQRVTQTASGLQIQIDAPLLRHSKRNPLKVDDSVAVNGVCQTVTTLTAQGFLVDTVQTTLEKSTLGSLKSGEQVNLETALTLERPLGGHLMQGHTSGIGEIVKIEQFGENRLITVSPLNSYQGKIIPFLVEEGSVAIDGVSLTIASISKTSENSFSETFILSIIPHSWKRTILKDKKVSSHVNIEVDILAKYVHKLLRHYQLPDDEVRPHPNSKSLISEEWLRKQGF